MGEVVADINVISFPAVLAGDGELLARLDNGERLCAVTPLRYPGRKGPVLVHLIPAGPAEQPGGKEPRPVRISDAGGLVRSLEEQGLDLSVNLIVSKTVFHAVREVEGARIGGGDLCLESNTADLVADVWRFLQLMVELIGLRHSKYKDALVHLSKRVDKAAELRAW